MLAESDIVAFVPTTDLARSRTFYEGTLGLGFLQDIGIAVVMDAGGTMLRLTLVPELRPAGYTILGWSVRDSTGTVRRLADAGVAVQRYEGLDQDDDGIWDSPGARVAWFADPDGNTLSLTQFAPSARRSG
jgi:catechol 2,3-dioxygenase-like lactoylglutathione lyase family enzyme